MMNVTLFLLKAHACLSLQDDTNATVDTVIWASPNSILVCLNSGPDADQAPMAVITWQVWDAETLGADPEGLMIQSAGSVMCSPQPVAGRHHT